MAEKNYLIGNAHLDPVWQWRVSEGLSLIRSTFRSALDRMKENENYKFTSACSGYYFWIKKIDPDMFKEIKQRVKEGRWGIVGGMWVQPDCNIPSGEAFCRHFLYSQKFLKENFGKITNVGYNVDSFGHSAVLPQLFKKSGIDNYVYMRPTRETENLNLPVENLHKWVSPDGSEVTAFRILELYNGDLSDERVNLYLEKPQDQMIFYGIGNHGGGPSKEHLKQAEEWVKKDGFSYATPDEYFENIEGTEMPTVAGDLKHHASGCYSANSRVKFENRRSECELVSAEIFDTLAGLIVGGDFNNSEFEKAWQRVMFNQFHDVIAGCCIKEAYTDAYNAFGYARQTAQELENFALQRIAAKIKTTEFLDADFSEMRDRLWYREGEGSPMVVFNPHPFSVKTYVSFGAYSVTKVVDHNGNEVPFQMVRAPYTDGGNFKKCLFEVELPSMGYRVYYVYKKMENSAETEVATDLKATETTLENSLVRIVIDKESGAVTSYVLKAQNREFAKGKLAQAIVCDDSKHDTWSHLINNLNDDIGAFGEGALSLIENGPVRATIKSVTKNGNSVLRKYYTLYKNDARLHIRCVLDVDEEYKLIKFSFPVNVESPKAVYSMPYGFIEKAPNGEEDVAHEWADMVDSNTGAGLGLINDGRYSHCAIDSDLRVIVARSCAYLDHYAQNTRDDEMEFIDKGEHEFNFILFPHTENAIADIANCGKVLNMPPVLVQETHHDGNLPQEYSALELDKKNISISALKNSENDDGLIIRFCETAGIPTTVTVKFTAINKSFELNFTAQEVKTIKLGKDGKIEEILIIE
ncbi:MAG: glycoside hydrolase family 38 C-terminal domain-containing protein [Oscillospiraceae bacterium]|nr:glycoside hydrolase family 38 C-terminal domain-containing protein [Oscillospiraceae bacterium]